VCVPCYELWKFFISSPRIHDVAQEAVKEPDCNSRRRLHAGACPGTASWHPPPFDTAASSCLVYILNKPLTSETCGEGYTRSGGLRWTGGGPSKRKSDFISEHRKKIASTSCLPDKHEESGMLCNSLQRCRLGSTAMPDVL